VDECGSHRRGGNARLDHAGNERLGQGANGRLGPKRESRALREIVVRGEEGFGFVLSSGGTEARHTATGDETKVKGRLPAVGHLHFRIFVTIARFEYLRRSYMVETK